MDTRPPESADARKKQRSDHAADEATEFAAANAHTTSHHAHDSSSSSQSEFTTLESDSDDTYCLLPTGWQWRDEYSGREDPVPAELVEVATLNSPLSVTDSSTCDIVCGLEFSPNGRWLATAGVSKQIRLYSIGELGATPRRLPSAVPAMTHRMFSKLSSLAWSPDVPDLVTVGDYDGALSQIHVGTGHIGSDVDAHMGRRVWSVAHSRRRPHLVASASDDRSAKLWTGRGLAQCAATITPPGRPASVCCADFSDHDDNLLVLASSNSNVYLYDLRSQAQPLAVLAHHTRPVSYVKFFGHDRLASASIDASLALWDLSGSGSSSNAAGGDDCSGGYSGCGSCACCARVPGGAAAACTHTKPWRVFSGHRNEKNFVGLAVRPEDGLLACGSESSDVFSYHTSWLRPLASYSVAAPAPSGGVPFVSSVSWHPASVSEQMGLPVLLAAATSNGVVKLLTLSQPATARDAATPAAAAVQPL